MLIGRPGVISVCSVIKKEKKKKRKKKGRSDGQTDESNSG